MKNNKDRPDTWKIGSFTKNFRWDEQPGLKRLYDAINIGFDGKLVPTKRSIFRERLASRGYIDLIPVNFFLFNKVVDSIDYIVVDELCYQAICFPHSENFDKLAVFCLLLSEVGRWNGASSDQQNPAEWARHFAIDVLANSDWDELAFRADAIERYFKSQPSFKGNTRKISTNLSFFFRKGSLEKFVTSESAEWQSNAIFLALDRYYTKLQPKNPSLGWALDTLAENDIADLIGGSEEITLEAQRSLARLFLEVQGPERLSLAAEEPPKSLIAILNRSPLLMKRLPEVVEKWIRHRLFVEIAKDETEVATILSTDYRALIDTAVAKLHNTVPKPTIGGDQIIALFRDAE